MGSRTLELARPEKLLFPNDGITKGDLIEYYRRVARDMVPHLRDRPVNLQRFPDGIERSGFFQQSMPAHYPDWIESVVVRKEGGRVRHVLIQDAATLVYLANQACITPHAWLSRRDRLRHPDQMIFDLDPADGEIPERLRTAARALGQLLREHGLTPFLKTTGSRGYHVLVPLDRSTELDRVRDFAQRVAALLARRQPDLLTTEVRKRARSGRIFLDTLRNAYAHTAVPPYAVRARPGAPVAVPLGWEELEDPATHPARFTIRTVPERLAAGVNPWRDLGRKAKGLEEAARRMGR